MLMMLALSAAATIQEPPNPDWNCGDPMAQQEMNWCAQQDYLAADAALNEQWKLTATAMKQRDAEFKPYDWDDRPGYFATLLEAQRAWIAYRDAHCRSEGYYARGGTLESLLVATCKLELTRQRTEQLQALMPEG